MDCVWGLVFKQKTVSPPARPRYSGIPYHRSPAGEHPRMFCVEFRVRALVINRNQNSGSGEKDRSKRRGQKERTPALRFIVYQ